MSSKVLTGFIASTKSSLVGGLGKMVCPGQGACVLSVYSVAKDDRPLFVRQVCVGQKMRSLIKAEQDGAAATLQATMRGRTQRATILFDKQTIAATKVWRMDRRERVPWVRRHILSRSTDRSCRHEKEVATPPRSCPSRPNNAA